MEIMNESHVRRHNEWVSLGMGQKQSCLFTDNYLIGSVVVSYVSAIIIDEIVEDIIGLDTYRGEKHD
jgi:hypothetical protein